MMQWWQDRPGLAYPDLVKKAISISIGGWATNGSTLIATQSGSVVAFGANNFGQVRTWPVGRALALLGRTFPACCKLLPADKAFDALFP